MLPRNGSGGRWPTTSASRPRRGAWTPGGPPRRRPGPVHPRRARYGTDKVGYVDMLKAYCKFDDRPMI
jgi:hypothetical protein